MSSFFSCAECERLLDRIIENEFENYQSSILGYRKTAEKLNTVIKLLPQLVFFNCLIGSEIIDVVTHSYSAFFFPELTHVGKAYYIEEYEQLYYSILKITKSREKAVIYDLGCGICDIAEFLFRHNAYKFYYAIDKNPAISKVNEHYYNYPNLIHRCTDIAELELIDTIDLMLSINVVKHIGCRTAMELFLNARQVSPNVQMVVQDIPNVIICLQHMCSLKKIPYSFVDNILIIGNR